MFWKYGVASGRLRGVWGLRFCGSHFYAWPSLCYHPSHKLGHVVAAPSGWEFRCFFIKREHAEYLAQAIPGAEFIVLKDVSHKDVSHKDVSHKDVSHKDVSHFAPLQRPEQFNSVMLEFVAKLYRGKVAMVQA
jgi:pimeloyl-ACP methyl ester carboxylesterase